MEVIIFDIEINIKTFIAKLLDKKLKNMAKVTSKILAKQSATFLEMQFLAKSLFFYLQVVYLGKVFIKKLWDYINEYPYAITKLI